MKITALLIKFTIVCAISGIDQFLSVHSNSVTLTLLYQGSYAAWKSLNSMEFHLLKIKALKAWNLIN